MFQKRKLRVFFFSDLIGSYGTISKRLYFFDLSFVTVLDMVLENSTLIDKCVHGSFQINALVRGG